jgi:hypothetical protein
VAVYVGKLHFSQLPTHSPDSWAKTPNAGEISLVQRSCEVLSDGAGSLKILARLAPSPSQGFAAGLGPTLLICDGRYRDTSIP